MVNSSNHNQRFPALYVRDFRVFWIGQVISFSGTWMQSTAQGWLVYSLTKSPLYLGIVATASSLPVLLFTLLGGVAADRFRKKKLLIITQSLSILPALLLGIMTDFKIITPLHIIVIAFSLGIINAFDLPARQSFLIEMVQRGRLTNAIALNSAAFNGARILGPLMAGFAIAYTGVATCFYINALSFLAAIIALIKIKGIPIKESWSTDSGIEGILINYFKDLREGLRFINGNKDILRTMVLVATFSLFGIPFVTLLPVFAEDILMVGAKGLGYLGGASGLGAFTAAFIIAYKGEIRAKGILMSIAALVFSLSLLAFSVSRYYTASLIILIFTGWGIVTFLALGNSFVQLTVPDELRGRVMSVYTLLFLGLSPLGNSLIGLIADLFGANRAIAMGSIICLTITILLVARLRELRIPP
ncbi:MAG: MFS transporter [Thermodesulfovibrionales bacterium]